MTTPSMPQARAFGARLRARRKQLGMSQMQVADLAGITLQHLSLLENGMSDGRTRRPANPSVGIVQGLSRALRVDIHFVVEPLDQPPPSGLRTHIIRPVEWATGDLPVARAQRPAEGGTTAHAGRTVPGALPSSDPARGGQRDGNGPAGRAPGAWRGPGHRA